MQHFESILSMIYKKIKLIFCYAISIYSFTISRKELIMTLMYQIKLREFRYSGILSILLGKIFLIRYKISINVAI